MKFPGFKRFQLQSRIWRSRKILSGLQLETGSVSIDDNVTA